MQQRGFMLALAAVVTIAVACGDDNSTPPGTVSSVAITGAPASFATGKTATLTATVTVANAASQAVTWSTSNAAVVSVAPSGATATITAVAPGSATITATSVFDATKSATASVTVVSPIVRFAATMTPANEPPPLVGNPTGSGTWSATLDTTTNVFTWTSTFSGLTTNINNGHIHGPFPSGTTASAGVILNFNPANTPGAVFTGLNSATAGAASGTVTLTPALALTAAINGDSLKKLLLAGAVYVNIHTVSNPGGEIRGQITKQ